MNIVKLLRGVSLSLAAVAILAAQSEAADVSAGNRIADIMLHDGGIMMGVLVDANGKSVAQQDVLLKQGNQVVAAAKSNAAGQFAVRGLRGGVYQIEAGNQRSLVRAWTAQTAPPAASQAIQLVTGDQVVRGQLIPGVEVDGGGISWSEAAGIGLGTAGVIIGIIALNDDGPAS
jgi:hypothetical protein